ncbi:MAG: SurA N-terminal domain-containing protein, partial [Pseudomonadota bacterium]
MLQTIRDNSKGVLALGLMFLLFLSFAIWGIDFQFGRPAAPVTVDGEPVALNKINNAYQRQLTSYQQIYPNGIPSLQLEELKQNVLRASAQEEVLYRHAEKLGFRVSDQALFNWISQQPGFQLGGAFSFDQFALQARQQGMAPDQFEEFIRRALIPEQLRKALVDTSFVTEREKSQRGALEQEARTVSYFTIPASRYLDEIEVSESEIAAEYEANLGNYKTVEAVRLEYIELNPEEIAADMPVDEDELRATYDQGVQAGSYIREETRKSRHILVAADTSEGDDADALAKAEGLLARVNDGEDFAALATEFSDDPGSKVNGGELDWSPRAAFVGPFSDALFALEVGEVSDIVKTNFGYHIIRLDDVRRDEVRSYDDVRSELAQDARMAQAIDRVDELSSQLDELSYEYDDTLEPASEETGLPLGETQWITRASGGGIGSDPTVREVAFSDRVLTNRRTSEAVRYRDGFLYLRIAEYRPARQQTLDEVRDTIESSLRRQAAATRAAEAGEDARDRLGGSGTTMADIAAEFEAEVLESVALTRRGGGTTPPEVVQAAYSAPAPSENVATLGGTAVGDNYAVFAVESVTPGSAMPEFLLSRYAQAVGTYEFRGFVEEVFSDA